MEIREITVDKKRLLPLLLLADPCEAMIDGYLAFGRLFVAEQDGAPVCGAVVSERPDAACELNNLATDAGHQNKGYASAMLRYLFARLGGRYHAMYVGTTPKIVPFYQRFGFAYHHTVPGFFTRNYPEPVYEDGVCCTDMLYLKKTWAE